MGDIRRNPDPSVHRRRLGRTLRNAREAVDRTQRDVVAAMDWSVSKLIRIEAGDTTISVNDLRALLQLYQITHRDDELTELATVARQPPRWHHYRNVVSPEHLSFLGCESSAAIIRTFEPHFVPPLLQTEDYAHAVISAFVADQTDLIEPLIDLRIERQEVLVSEPTTELHFILDEAVIRRIVGSTSITRRQLQHLLDLAEYPNVTIRVVPFTAGFCPRVRAAYVIFEFSENDDVLYVDGPTHSHITGDGWIGNREDVGTTTSGILLAEFWRLEHLATQNDSLNLLANALNGMR